MLLINLPVADNTGLFYMQVLGAFAFFPIGEFLGIIVEIPAWRCPSSLFWNDCQAMARGREMLSSF